MKMLAAGSTALLATIATPAVAQDADPPANDRDIVVEGVLDVDGVAARQQADDITQRPSSSSEPLARWQQPVCAGVYGLSFDNAVAVINRVHDIAELAGLEVDENPECAANMWIIIVDDPAETFADLREQDNWMVRSLERYELNSIEEQAGPVRAWNLSSTRTRDGRPIPTGHEAVNLHLEELRRGRIPWNNVWNMSRLQTAIRRDIDGSFVLVQRSAIGNIDAYSLADYAAMRMLARTGEPPGDTSFSTILRLFDDDTAPTRVTAFDRAYLRSVNRGSAFRPSSSGLASLDELMEKEMLREAGQLVED